MRPPSRRALVRAAYTGSIQPVPDVPVTFQIKTRLGRFVRISQWADRMATRLATDSGRPARRRSTAFPMGGPHRGGPHGTPLRLGTRSRYGGGAPRSAAPRWDAAANPWLGAIARCQAARYRAARRGAMRSAHCEIRLGENVTLLYLSHDRSPGPPPCGPIASASQSPL